MSLLYGLGLSLVTVATSTDISEIIAGERLGASMGLLSSIMDVGHSFGPLVIGSVITYTSMTAGFFSAFAICAVLFAVVNFKMVYKIF